MPECSLTALSSAHLLGLPVFLTRKQSRAREVAPFGSAPKHFHVFTWSSSLCVAGYSILKEPGLALCGVCFPAPHTEKAVREGLANTRLAIPCSHLLFLSIQVRGECKLRENWQGWFRNKARGEQSKMPHQKLPYRRKPKCTRMYKNRFLLKCQGRELEARWQSGICGQTCARFLR